MNYRPSYTGNMGNGGRFWSEEKVALTDARVSFDYFRPFPKCFSNHLYTTTDPGYRSQLQIY